MPGWPTEVSGLFSFEVVLDSEIIFLGVYEYKDDNFYLWFTRDRYIVNKIKDVLDCEPI